MVRIRSILSFGERHLSIDRERQSLDAIVLYCIQHSLYRPYSSLWNVVASHHLFAAAEIEIVSGSVATKEENFRRFATEPSFPFDLMTSYFLANFKLLYIRYNFK